MSWYLARRFMGCRVAGKPSDIEEDFFVVSAGSLKQAKAEALRLSKAEELSYENVYGQEVTWQLQDIIDVTDLGIARFRDGMWLYRRAFPGISRLPTRSNDRLSVNSRALARNGKQGWWGAMLLFRTRQKPVREEERLLLLRATRWDATEKALLTGKNAADKSQENLVGAFDVHDLLDKSIRSGTEIYYRFFAPGELRKTGQPPRQKHLTVPEFASIRTPAQASA